MLVSMETGLGFRARMVVLCVYVTARSDGLGDGGVIKGLVQQRTLEAVVRGCELAWNPTSGNSRRTDW